MQQKFSLQRILSLLKKSNIVSKIEIISIDEIAGRSVYRIRCSLIPDIRTYPHHFHDRNGNVIESDLKGIVIDDLNIILCSIKKMLR